MSTLRQSRLSASSGSLRKTGEITLANGDGDSPVPKLPMHLSVSGLTTRKKLSNSTGNLHGYRAEDYKRLSWLMPKMFGEEKYAHSLIDIEDPRYLKECAQMSKKLIRLNYDLQIVDLEWRKTYKALLGAEHRKATLPKNCQEKTKKILESECQACMKYLLECQEQRDLYEQHIKDVYARCDAIKATIKKENDLEDLRMFMEKGTQERLRESGQEELAWRTKFNYRSQNAPRQSLDNAPRPGDRTR